MPSSREPILRTCRLTKRFPGVTALKQVDFELRPGEVHAVCGENGAGKSTLIKTLSGIHPYGSYEGEIEIEGRSAAFASVRDTERAGLAVIYQELALIPEMSAAENIFLGKEPTRAGIIDWDHIYREAKRLLDQFGITIDPGARIDELGVGQQQLIEIAKALAKRSRILILDEPTAALSQREVEVLLGIIRDLRRRDIACIYISHKLDEVFQIADRISVLRDGERVATLDTSQTHPDAVIRHMVGREIGDRFPRRRASPGAVLLSVRGLSVAKRRGESPRLEAIDLELRAGEVLGLGGLMGAGRSELLMHLFGAWGHRTSGEIMLGDRPLPADRPPEAIQRGLVLVSEDRKRFGLVLDQPVGFNLSLSNLARISRGGLIDADEEAECNQRLFESLGIRAPTLETPVAHLSGGNQQKVVLGKALMTEPKVMILDEPTRGIDVGAKVEVYALINELVAQGLGVLIASSELSELMGLADRIVMLAQGRIGGTFSREHATQERLLSAAMGHSTTGEGRRECN